MKEQQNTVYITDGGKIFSNKNEAINHEEKLNNVKYFVVRYAPDLTEGRGLQKVGIVMVNARNKHKDFVEHWCYKQYGNRIDFCMGVFGSNAIVPCWNIFHADEKDLESYEVIDKIEEEFVNKIWE